MLTDRQTIMTKLIVAFRNFSNACKNLSFVDGFSFSLFFVTQITRVMQVKRKLILSSVLTVTYLFQIWR